MKNKQFLIKIIVGILLILTISLIIINEKRLSKLEKLKINEFNKDIINYTDEIYEYNDEGKYISFAIEYLYNKKNKTSYTDEEIIETINSIFNKNYTIKSLEKIGISSRMADKGITHDTQGYKYNYFMTKKDISNETIYKYSIKKIKKVSKKKFTITYDRLVVDNPYEILNYYNEKNINSNKKYDTTVITNYLNAEGKLEYVKDKINEDNIKEIGKIDGKITINFIIKNDKLLIDKIK